MVVNAAAGLHVKRYGGGGGLEGAAEAGEVDAAQGGIIDADDLFFITTREGGNEWGDDGCAEAALALSGNGAGKGRGGRLKGRAGGKFIAGNFQHPPLVPPDAPAGQLAWFR